ncbi:MAG: alpha-N-acetylglucosaminidase N-terminal domain-containing protein [Kiritimatiellae bacterium]|nr:alpha-N-acetylglucosaminidase N-terminal domain-containing protein [Kiritimatiellia bacterium]
MKINIRRAALLNAILSIAAASLTGRSLAVPPAQDPAIAGARGVLERVVGPERARTIVLETLPLVEERDVYEYLASGGTLTLRGSSAVALCRGAYDYLRAGNLGTVGWAGPRLRLTTQWPDAPLSPMSSPFCWMASGMGFKRHVPALSSRLHSSRLMGPSWSSAMIQAAPLAKSLGTTRPEHLRTSLRNARTNNGLWRPSSI